MTTYWGFSGYPYRIYMLLNGKVNLSGCQSNKIFKCINAVYEDYELSRFYFRYKVN